MTLILLSQLPWLAALVVVVRHFQGDAAARHDALCVERAEWRQERRDLLNRIQAPEAAQKQAEVEIPQIPDGLPFVGWDDDDGFHEARKVTVDG